MKHVEVVNQNLHVQGFTTDGKYMYWSFTDSLVKTTMSGTVLIQVPTATRWEHLGGLDYHNGRIYAACMSRNPNNSSIHVYDAGSLAVVNIFQLKNMISDMDNQVDNNNGAGCITVGIDPETNEEVLMVGCGIRNGSKFPGQIIMQYDFEGNYQKKYIVPTGCTCLGIQNIDRDPDTGCYWMTGYGRNMEHHIRETLFCVSPDLKTVLSSYIVSSPYGIHCCGGGKFYLSVQSGVNGHRVGYAYEADMAFIEETAKLEYDEEDTLALVTARFDAEMGL